jgi:hypothetical protein
MLTAPKSPVIEMISEIAKHTRFKVTYGYPPGTLSVLNLCAGAAQVLHVGQGENQWLPKTFKSKSH